MAAVTAATLAVTALAAGAWMQVQSGRSREAATNACDGVGPPCYSGLFAGSGESIWAVGST